MRILQLIQKPQRRGAEIFAIQLSEELIKLGHNVLVVNIFPGLKTFNFSGQTISLDRDLGKRLFDFYGWKNFAKIIKDWQPDLIQANAADTLKFASFSKKIFRWKIPIIYRNANQMGDFIKGNLHRKFNQFLIDSISGVVSVSDASKNDIQKTFSFSKEKSVVIPIGIDPSEIISKSQDVSNVFNLPAPYIIQIGGLVSEKDPLGMLEIFSKLSDNNVNLIFLGSGPLEKILCERIEHLKLENRVQIIPNQPNIFPYLKGAKALVMASKIEGLPGVILEAMYVKVPVIAFGVGGIPEVLKNGDTGWCVTPNDHNGFILAIKDIFSIDADKKETILFNAFQLVTSNFSLQKVALQFEDFYKRLLDSRAK